MLLIFTQSECYIMSTRFFYIWICVTVSGSYLCQLYKSFFINIVSVFVVSASVALLFMERLKGYRANPIAHYKFRMIYDLVLIVVVSCSLLFIGIFCFDKSYGFYYLLYLLHIIPLLPIIIHTVLINKNSIKK